LPTLPPEPDDARIACPANWQKPASFSSTYERTAVNKHIARLVIFTLGMSLATLTPAQEQKPTVPPKPALSPSQELLLGWQSVFGKVITMAKDFPQDKYNFKAQEGERTFGENLIHVSAAAFNSMTAFTGAPMWQYGKEDSLRKKFATKEEVVGFLSKAAEAGEQLIKEEADNGLNREVKYPWGKFMVHGSFIWYGILEHTGEHYGQLVVYYRLNGLIPPASRPKK
jgi:uncharacterized damage-inducible protein DinB